MSQAAECSVIVSACTREAASTAPSLVATEMGTLRMEYAAMEKATAENQR